LKKIPFVLIFVFITLTTLNFVYGATITVNQSGGADYKNLTDALAAVSDGDRILLETDIYNWSNLSDEGSARFVVDKEISIDFGFSNGDVNGGIPVFEIRSSNVRLSNLNLTGNGELSVYVNGKGTGWVNCSTQYNNITVENFSVSGSGMEFVGVTNLNVRNNTYMNLGKAVRVYNSCNTTIVGNVFKNVTIYDINDYTVLNGDFGVNTFDLGRVHSAFNLNMAKFSGAPKGAPELSGSIGTFWNISATISGSIATVTVGYNQSAVDAASVNESTLRLYHLNASSMWEALPSEVDTFANLIHGNTTSFSVFGVAGETVSSEDSSPPASGGAVNPANGHSPPSEEPPEAPELKNIRRFFKSNTIVVYGNEVDAPVAVALSRYFSPENNLPIEHISSFNKKLYRNVILVGGPVANSFVDVLNKNGELPVRFGSKPNSLDWYFEGKRGKKASIQILPRSDYPYLKILVVAGVDRKGTWRAAQAIIEGEDIAGTNALM
jgi:hypothetical protein